MKLLMSLVKNVATTVKWPMLWVFKEKNDKQTIFLLLCAILKIEQ